MVWIHLKIASQIGSFPIISLYKDEHDEHWKIVETTTQLTFEHLCDSICVIIELTHIAYRNWPKIQFFLQQLVLETPNKPILNGDQWWNNDMSLCHDLESYVITWWHIFQPVFALLLRCTGQVVFFSPVQGRSLPVINGVNLGPIIRVFWPQGNPWILGHL